MMDKIKEEFYEEFKIKITANSNQDYDKAKVLESYYKFNLETVADWWLSKIQELISQHNEILIKKIEEEKAHSIKNMEYQRDITKNYSNTKFWDGVILGEDIIITLIKNSK